MTFLCDSGVFVKFMPLIWCESHLCETAAGSHDRSDGTWTLRVILDAILPIQAVIVVGEPLFDLGVPCRALITYLGSFNENRVVDY